MTIKIGPTNPLPNITSNFVLLQCGASFSRFVSVVPDSVWFHHDTTLCWESDSIVVSFFLDSIVVFFLIRYWKFGRRCPWGFAKEINSNSQSPCIVIEEVFASRRRKRTCNISLVPEKKRKGQSFLPSFKINYHRILKKLLEFHFVGFYVTWWILCKFNLFFVLDSTLVLNPPLISWFWYIFVIGPVAMANPALPGELHTFCHIFLAAFACVLFWTSGLNISIIGSFIFLLKLLLYS